MLSAEENKLFTEVGPGTPMGEVLRRYWQPCGVSQEVTKKPQRTKLLGEELVLYRGDDGKPVLMQLRCAHRSLALDYGRVEGTSLRCPYHGWLYASNGQCLAQPAEPEGSSFKDKIKLTAYKVEEHNGLVFAYMGPDPAPVMPLFDVMRMTDGMKAIQVQNVFANWFNHVENIVDISHLAWLHGYTFPAYGAKKVTYHWNRKPYGADNVMDIEGIDDTHTSCYGFPNVNRFAGVPVKAGGAIVPSMIWRVPNDDENTTLYFLRFDPDGEKKQVTSRRVNVENVYQKLEADWWGINVTDQDRMAVEQQGVVADRENEHLGVSDGGLILMRKMMREALDAVAAGEDPPAVIRDPAKANVEFPQRSTMLNQRQADNNVDYGGGFWGEKKPGIAAE